MRSKPCLMTVTLSVLALAATLPALAEEILYFTNGSQMPVVSHWIEGDMTHVDLGGNGFMAFPTALIDKIDTDTKIQLRPSSAVATRGQMVAGDRGVGGTRVERPQPLPLKIEDDGIETDKNGMAVITPLKGQGRAAEKLKQYALPTNGSSAGQRQRGGFQGARREGNHHVIDSGQRVPQTRVGLQRRYGGED